MDMVPFDTNSTIQLLTDCFAIMQNVKAFDFDDPMLLSEEPYYNMTGLKKRYVIYKTWLVLIFNSDQFSNLLSKIQSMPNSCVRSIRVALAVFLVNTWLGVSSRVLGSIFRVKNKHSLSRIIHEVAETLSKDFIPYYLGLQQIERDTGSTISSNFFCFIINERSRSSINYSDG